ncbi:HlyD family efflux transporter periplasmic adaptor subunit [Maribacter algarum]|uniref:HlyD family efflux transporter periplasmic adaptor subunit n=1 Tax=Maribacter algarum (ex Zhang et al. 2020) TaxID=2578118 RepID=A0A5S3PVZ9_9FLAO|nr:HlyD family efflux transporter periplasmic adaptor subunit [Maribacter algarum]TMM59133.1 HlyD family efflux transporter periplasmic adaptor subunit [Maribacter algarum]
MADKQKRKIDDLDQRSDQVKEILGKSPSWILRSGITLVAVLVCLLLIGSALISYNDIIPAQIVITSKNPPVYLKANATGKLTNVFVTANQKVSKDQPLAEIENTANIDDILYLKKKLKNFKATIVSTDSLRKLFPASLSLGSVQLTYGDFLTQYQNYILFNALTPNKKESAVIQQQLNEQQSLLNKQQRQLQFYKEDLELSEGTYLRNKKLHDKGVISDAEFENASRAYLNDQQNYEGFKSAMSNTQITIANYFNLLTKSGIEGEEFKNSYRQQLEKAYQNLNNEFLQWEQTYLLKSPIDGKVTVFDIWNKNQNVAVGETIFTVVPNDLEEIIGRVTLPIQNSGKVKPGQKVIIKLANYPFQEWGSLEGEIVTISEVPKQGQETFYTVYLKINALTTSYSKTISFKQEMNGTAEIIIEELTVLQRIFYQLRKVFDSE